MGIEKILAIASLAIAVTACSATSAPNQGATPAAPASAGTPATSSPKIAAPTEVPLPAAPQKSPPYPIKGRPNPGSTTTAGDGRFAVSMGRSVCFGRCPQYHVTVHSDGLVEFVGERYVNAMGAHSKRIDPASAAQLLAPARTLFSAMQDYTPENKACRPYATDHPSISLGFDEDGSSRTLRHYLGCPNPPAMLTDFEQLVDQVADVGEWTTNSAER